MADPLDILSLVALIGRDRLEKLLNKDYYYWQIVFKNHDQEIKKFKPIENPLEFLVTNLNVLYMITAFWPVEWNMFPSILELDPHANGYIPIEMIGTNYIRDKIRKKEEINNECMLHIWNKIKKMKFTTLDHVWDVGISLRGAKIYLYDYKMRQIFPVQDANLTKKYMKKWGMNIE